MSRKRLATTLSYLALLGGAQASLAAQAATAAACRPNPLGDRVLYVRGEFNQWTADDKSVLRWACDRFAGVVAIEGRTRFKLGDEGWSADADFGTDPAAPESMRRLAPRGKEITHAFHGTHRIGLDMSQSSTHPTLSIEDCAAQPAGGATLFLRGGMNNWTALDQYAFQWSCDAYYLNVKLSGRHEFKIGDAGWDGGNTFGATVSVKTIEPDTAFNLLRGNARPLIANLAFDFDGEHTLRLAFPGGSPTLAIGPKTFADPNEAGVDDPVALSLRHDSRAASDKSPFGAVTAGTEVEFALHAAAGVEAATLVVESRRLEGNQDLLEYRELARLPMPAQVAAGGGAEFRATHRFADKGVYGYWFLVRIGGRDFAYQNNRDAVPWTREKGSNGSGRVEALPAPTPAPDGRGAFPSVRRYRLTVYDPAFSVPDWAQDAVYYYIFPDRFRNGDRGNDPKPGIDKYQDTTVELHANWGDRPWKPGTGDGSDAVYNNDFFGGDLAGIVEKLDYIAALGANTIYMTPVMTAASNHKYDTADYRNVDPGFGSNADFERLCAEAARRGIRVIPDASLNHVGSDSIYFDRYRNFGGQGAFAGGRINPASPYASWFTFDPAATEPDKQYKGWVGVTSLPELDKSSADFRRFAYGERDSVMQLWLDRGAAGWRMDVAPWVPDDFWREWRAAIKRHRPDALTIAETWFDSSKYFLGDMFDSTMNYVFRNTLLDYANGGDARVGYRSLELLREAYPPQALHALMNLLSSHDTARSLHLFGYSDGEKDGAKIALAKQRLRLAMFFQMTYPGAPAIFYGDEVGVTGGEDPFNRGAYPWPELGGQPDAALLADVRALVRMRKDNPVFARGSLEAPLHLDEHLIVLLRRHADAWAVSATNNDDAPRTIRVRLPAGAPRELRDALSGTASRVDAEGVLELRVAALSGLALVGTGD